MSNLHNFFGGAGGGGVPLRGLVPFPHNTPVKVIQGSQVFLRSGWSELVDYDPSLQPWVDDNIMFVNTRTNKSSELPNSGIPIGVVDTDGTGKWMLGGYSNLATHTLPRLYYSSDDGATWSTLNPPISNSSQVSSIKSGGNGVWLISTTTGSSNIQLFRTTDNGANWSDISTSAFGGISANDFRTMETNRSGVWMLGFGTNRTTLRRSADNGATWNTVNYPANNCFTIRHGNGVWVAGTADTSSINNVHSTLSISTDNGVTWGAAVTLVGLSLADFVYTNGNWFGLWGTAICRLDSADFTKWEVVDTLYDDSMADYQNNSVRWSLSAGLDNTLWIHFGSAAMWRSSDGGRTITRCHIPLPAVMAGPNKRAVGFNNSMSRNDVVYGIVTGRPAAGIPIANDGRATTGWLESVQRYVMYVRIR